MVTVDRVETLPINLIDKNLWNKLCKLTFGRGGWMWYAMKTVRNKNSPSVLPDRRNKYHSPPARCKQLIYNKGYAVIAYDPSDQILGWALVRVPSRRRWTQIHRKRASAGERPDIMVYVKHQRQGIGRKLLLSAYSQFGKLTVYPWDGVSRAFYDNTFPQFTVRRHIGDMSFAETLAREIFR